MSCRRWRGDLAEAAFRDPDALPGSPLGEHLVQCPACRAELGLMRDTLEAAASGMPDPADLEVADAWARVESALGAPSPPVRRFRPGLTLGYPLAAAAAASLMILGTWIGYRLQPETDPPLPIAQSRDPAAAAAESTQPRAGRHGAPATAGYVRYLERATPLLLALANRNGHGSAEAVTFEADLEQRLAGELALEASDLRLRLERDGHRREARLVESLEVVLLQIANLTPETYPDKLELLQATIAQRAVLFQLTLEEMRRAAERDQPLG